MKRSRVPIFFVALLFAVVLRLFAVSLSNFPLWDGGLFYSLVRHIEANHFVLPRHTTYNHAHIPLAYPPLGLYLAGAAHVGIGLSLFQVFRWLPFVVNVLSLGAFVSLVCALLESERSRVAAVFAYALLPDGLYTLGGA